MEVSAMAPLAWGKYTNTHWVEDWVRSKTGLVSVI
jgi:hypothetical protein